MGDAFKDANFADFGSANCVIGLGGCQPDQSLFVAATMTRFAQRVEGESCYGTSGVCAPGLYCNRGFRCARLPWDPPSTNTYPFYLYGRAQAPAKPGLPNDYALHPRATQ